MGNGKSKKEKQNRQEKKQILSRPSHYKYNTVQSRPLVQYSASAVYNNNVIHTTQTPPHTYKERASKASSLLVSYKLKGRYVCI